MDKPPKKKLKYKKLRNKIQIDKQYTKTSQETPYLD